MIDDAQTKMRTEAAVLFELKTSVPFCHTTTLKNDCPKERYGERSPHRTIIQTNDKRSDDDPKEQWLVWR
jgi:hypothetical protein